MNLNPCGWLWWVFDWLVYLLTGEWVLRWLPNGGTVILARCLLVMAWFYPLVMLGWNLVDPGQLWPLHKADKRIVDTAPYMFGVFVGFYAALHTRFSDQWTYLSNCYNEIKTIECQGCNEAGAKKLVEWKSDFVMDAITLHLATKPLFAGIIKSWFDDEEEVRNTFRTNSYGKEAALLHWRGQVDRVCNREEKEGKRRYRR